jgi:hypothetical protein
MNKTITPVSGVSFIGLRVFCFFGVILTAALLYLGGMWPSLFTIVAIFALPSPILFFIAFIRPSFIKNHLLLKCYLIGCSIAAVLCWLSEIALLRHLK